MYILYIYLVIYTPHDCCREVIATFNINARSLFEPLMSGKITKITFEPTRLDFEFQRKPLEPRVLFNQINCSDVANIMIHAFTFGFGF